MKKIFGVVLAAGTASRFGSTKQMAEIDGAPLVKKAYDVAAQAIGEDIVLVTGHDWRAVHDACQPFQGFLLFNSDYADGIGTSIAQAVRAIQHAADAVVILLADQVLISTDHVQGLVAAWDGSPNQIVATEYAGIVGAPTLFPAGCFADLGALSSDSGGRQLLSDERFQLRTLIYEAAAVDIDTPDDLKQI
jgi:molybdenum cofactor cytidylyltransferase